MNIVKEKEIIRKFIYDSLFENNLSKRPNGDYGKIPDFKQSNIAADKLAQTKEWKNAKTIFVSPDSAQIPVRYNALLENKQLIMASPNLEKGYLFLEGKNLNGLEKDASTKEGAFKYCTNIEKFPSVDLVVEGAVAVDIYGHRLGKGGGYGDREIADLFERTLINSKTPLATTIHPLQLIDYVPTLDHDMNLNMIVTTEDIFYCFNDV